MSIWQASLSAKGASRLMSWFPPAFLGTLVNATVLTLLLISFAEKKRFNRGVLADTARFLRFFSLETLSFLAPDCITNFGIALAKHCNIALWSFVSKISDQKHFLTEHAIACGVNQWFSSSDRGTSSRRFLPARKTT